MLHNPDLNLIDRVCNAFPKSLRSATTNLIWGSHTELYQLWMLLNENVSNIVGSSFKGKSGDKNIYDPLLCPHRDPVRTDATGSAEPKTLWDMITP